MNREEAKYYLQSSGFSEEQIDTIEKAFTSTDAISRQAVLDDFGFSEKTRKWGGDHSGYNTMMLYEIQDVIESQPPVKPQEKTGHWIWCFGSHKCSNCEKYTCFSHKELLRYCPNCGCRMVEPQESEERDDDHF